MTDQTMAQPRRPTSSPAYFRSLKIAGAFIFAMAFAGGLIIAIHHGPLAIALALFALYNLQAAFASLMGVVLADGEIRFPRPIIRPLPFLVFWRSRQSIAALDDITSLAPSFGSEWVMLRFGETRIAAPFASRLQRLAFFEAIKARKPTVRIYRA